MMNYFCCWTFAISLALVGCSGDGKLARVHGDVTINNQPVAKGSIAFFPVDGKSQVTGTEIVAGKYNSEIPIGESKVEIRVPIKTGTAKAYDTPESPTYDTFSESLPAKYNTSSELRFTAKAGNQEKHWNLTSP